MRHFSELHIMREWALGFMNLENQNLKHLQKESFYSTKVEMCFTWENGCSRNCSTDVFPKFEYF